MNIESIEDIIILLFGYGQSIFLELGDAIFPCEIVELISDVKSFVLWMSKNAGWKRVETNEVCYFLGGWVFDNE